MLCFFEKKAIGQGCSVRWQTGRHISLTGSVDAASIADSIANPIRIKDNNFMFLLRERIGNASSYKHFIVQDYLKIVKKYLNFVTFQRAKRSFRSNQNIQGTFICALIFSHVSEC